MKVCLLNESFPPVLDGTANVLLNYARYLPADYGCPVIIGTPRYPGADYGSYPYPVVPYKSFDTVKLANGYRTGNPFDERDVSALSAFRPDLIHSHCPATANIIARFLRERTGAPIVFTYHTKYDIDLRRIFKVKSLAEESIRAMVSNIEACDDVWVVSRGAGESLKALGFTGETHVMNNGVDFERGRVDDAAVAAATAGWDLPAGVPVFLFVGRLITYKGIPLILDALKMVSDSGQDFRMVFIGKGPDQEALEKKARDYGFLDDNGIPGKCLFTGPIYDRDVLRAWNTRADLFLFPSTFDTNGLVVREAAACGLASVLIRDSCAAEDVTDGRNGYIIDETPEAMARLLLALSRDLPAVRQVGERAMDEIYLSWKDAVGKAYERYLYVMDQKASGAYEGRTRHVTDFLVAMAARSMEEADRARRVRHAFFDDFRDSAVGMMENIQETTDSFETMYRRFSDELERSADRVRDGVRRAAQEAEEGLTALAEEKKREFTAITGIPLDEDEDHDDA